MNRSLATDAVQQQKAAAAEAQKQNQPTFEYKLQAAQPQQQMQPPELNVPQMPM